MAPTQTRTMSAAERRAADKQRLEDAVRALLTSDGWQSWLGARASFHAYSFHNSLLIASQLPTATRVAGFHAWRKLGRQVRKGERGIRIFAPCTYTTQNDDGEDERRVSFRTVSVFDISQTDGDPLPQPPSQPITGDTHAHHIPALHQLAAEIEYTVRIEPVPGGARGYCNPREQVIVVDHGQPPNAVVHVLIHELAHALGIGYAVHGRERAETLVEAVAYIVCRSIGLDTSGASVPYVAGWNSDDLTSLHDFAHAIDETARRIEHALTNPQPEETAA